MNVGVVGAGIFGVATALELRSRGHDVTLFEQGAVPHEKASSTDVSKVIRRDGYGANDTYLPLLRRAAGQWKEWQERLGETLYVQTGKLVIYRDFRPGTRGYDSWSFLGGWGPEIELLTPQEARARFPQLIYLDSDLCVYDPWAGYVATGKAVEVLARLARTAGVTVREETPITHVEEGPCGVEVTANGDRVVLDRVVVATGAWMGRLVPQLQSRLRVSRHHIALIQMEDPNPFPYGSMPVWSINEELAPDEPDWEMGWYGFTLPDGLIKVCNAEPGEVVDPDIDRHSNDEFVDAMREFVAERVPALANGELIKSHTCLYTETPDRDFLIDWVPGSQRILMAGGGSGHGGKFGGSIGELVADALEDRANSLGDMFRIGDRFSAEVAVGQRELRLG
jgi:glycine/D-amino acid oxidase-like deaminating enzyme